MTRFPWRNGTPFTAILGIPSGWTRPDGPAAELAWDIASHAMAQQSGADTLLLDGETHTLTLRLQHTLGGRLSLGLELPWISHAGGFMDRPIDAWHDAFGLSEGIRPSLPHGDLQFAYTEAQLTRFSLRSRVSGAGDLRTAAALRVRGAGGTPGSVRVDVTADVEWPTGDPDRLTGSDGTDFSAGLRIGRPPAGNTRLGWSLGAGITWPDDSGLALPPTSSHILYYDATAAWAATSALRLAIQVQGHDAPYRSNLKMLGSTALQLGGGLTWTFTEHAGLRFAIFEDIRTDTAPDFSAELALFIRP